MIDDTQVNGSQEIKDIMIWVGFSVYWHFIIQGLFNTKVIFAKKANSITREDKGKRHNNKRRDKKK